ncbi:SGNH/GDSL hydrolase family protein [Actinacidiphila acidipaludis]|uniref:SGNH/GDSL hydrolase family protein n=1 Tax=Actinacidiphila acidipaludis TaxID=2873382 RepID=A0ABS7Q6S8_9ACTN|nr:SGNH/GDSL hydrolase family protein [Streptomyces acidipaludis]MBY8878844.1 SGNH/GDSL hydrolase family protein [Streptomyces acidipaludis]
MRRHATLIGLLLGAMACLGMPATATAAGPAESGATAAQDGASWVGTWSAAANGGVSDSGYAGYTIRNLVHTSLGGGRVRVKLSNAFGTKPVLFAHSTVGLQRLPGNAAIAPGTLRDLTFGGSRAVTVPAGAEIYSDPVDLPLGDSADLFVTTFTPDPSGPVTYHDLGVTTSYYSTDGTDHAADLTAGGLPSTTGAWHYVTEVDVAPASAQAGAVVTLGDSITDGYQSTPGADHRWPDLLSARLRAHEGPAAGFGVLNAGISGNRVLLDGAGVRATARLDRDVLQRAGARTVIVLEGINDIQQTPHQLDPNQIIAGLHQIADRAHAAGLRVLGGTILPFEGWGTYDASEEAARQGVNDWIRTSGVFDAVVDFDAAIRDPADPHRMLPRYDSGDHLHPGDVGYQAMADTVDLAALGHPGPVHPAPPVPPRRSLTVAVAPQQTVAIAGRAADVAFTSRAFVQAPGTVHGTLDVALDGVHRQKAFSVISQGRYAQLDLTDDVPVPASTAPGTHDVTFTIRTDDGRTATAVATLDVERMGCAQADDACALDLGGAYDRDSIASAAHPDDGNFDGLGWSYAAETLPAAGPAVLAGTPFTFPTGADGALNSVTAHGQSLPLPGLRAGGLRVLGAASGGAVDDVATVTYTDGSTASVPVHFSDWAAGPQAGEDVAVAAPYRYRAGAGRDGPAVDVYARTIPLDPARTVRSITLPDQSRLKLFALTLQQTH